GTVPYARQERPSGLRAVHPHARRVFALAMTILLQNYDSCPRRRRNRCLCRDRRCVRVMPPAVFWLKYPFAAADRHRGLLTAILAAIHLASAALLLVFETD